MSKVHKFLIGGTVAAGLTVMLTDEQAAARAHILTLLDPETKAKRKPYGVDAPAFFKAGEEIGIEGSLGRELQAALGIKDDDKPTKKSGAGAPTKAELKKAFDDGVEAGKAEASEGLDAKLSEAREAGKKEALVDLDAKLTEARKAGRSEMLAELEQRNALFDALEAAQGAQEGLSSDADDEAKAAAQKAVDEAQAAIDALKPLEA